MDFDLRHGSQHHLETGHRWSLDKHNGKPDEGECKSSTWAFHPGSVSFSAYENDRHELQNESNGNYGRA